MNVKIKITVEQFKYLVQFVNKMLDKYCQRLTYIQILNIGSFVRVGTKKLIDYSLMLQMTPYKEKTISIEVNQYIEILKLFKHEEENLDSYYLAIWVTMTSQTSKLNLLS